ncbi:Bsu YqfO NIF3/CutA domain [uncultured Gammaproteobacteria bacterium]|nr:Bsu YqfO NIF3/CutA domain [uncultured Gammaproteobacteria bacterium]
MYQINFYVPKSALEVVKNAMFKAGSGQYNNYEQCAWQTLGQGQFKPINNAKPAIGVLNKLETLKEYKVEMLCAKENLKATIKAMKSAHPCEQVAYSILKMENL